MQLPYFPGWWGCFPAQEWGNCSVPLCLLKKKQQLVVGFVPSHPIFLCSLSIICSIFTTDQVVCKPQAWLLKHRCKWDMVNWPLSPPCRTAGPPVSRVVEHHPGEDRAGGTSSRRNCPSAPLGTAWRGPSMLSRNQLSRSFLCCSQIPALPGVINALAVC